MSYGGVTGITHAITLRFGGVRHLTLPEFLPACYVSEIEVEDVSSDQLEGAHYRLKSHGSNRLEVLSRTIEIVACEVAGQ
jgi:hypothetical protein